MSFSITLQETISPYHLLSHPFYQAWTRGELTREQLQHYARQYQPFVEAFPRFVSAVHSNCENATARQMMLENLMDEEGKTGHSAPHPELWQDFISALGAKTDETNYGQAALAMKQAFLSLCQKSYAEGLTALYAYEYQTPAISKTKIEGLKAFYGLDSEQATAFFAVHEVADVYHSKTCAALIDALPADQQAAALASATTAAKALWDFLTEAYGDAAQNCVH